MTTLFLPEILLSIWFFAFLVISLFKKPWNPRSLTLFAGAGAIAVLAATFMTAHQSGILFAGTYKVDLMSQTFKTLIVLGLCFTVFFSRDLASIADNCVLEYYLFLFASALGMTMIPSSVNLLTLYVSMELSSYSLYLLTGLRAGRLNAEASVKYLIFGAATSGVFLWGSGLVMAMTQDASFGAIASYAASGQAQGVFYVGALFVLFAFLFKLSAGPVHFWAPDVYQTAATPVTAFIATASKAAAVAVLVRFLQASGVAGIIAPSLGIFAFLSMTLGNTVALVQKDVKRLLAYSSVAQAGYILVGLLSGTPEGYSATLFYALAYVLMNAAVFLVVLSVAKNAQTDNPGLSHFDGLAERSPKLALLLLLGLLSLAGIPPLVGFTGKWILFTAAMQQGHWFLVLWAVLNSVVSLFYYLTLVKHAYLEKAADKKPFAVSAPMMTLALVLLAALVGLGVFPDAFITLTQQALQNSSIVR